MSKQVAISTASFCLWGITPKEKLSICRILNFSQIEIALSTSKMVKDLLALGDLSEDLKTFKKITIHAPWCGVQYGDNQKTKEIMSNLALLYERLKVSGFIFHFDCIKDFRVLTGSGLPFLIENSEKPGSWDNLRPLMEKADFKFVLNINRAARSENYLEDMVGTYKEKIDAVYVSGFRDKTGRMPILEAGQSDLLNEVSHMEQPFVIEGLFAPRDLDAIKRERDIIAQKLKIA